MKDKEKYIDEFLSIINPKKKVSPQKKAPIPETIPEPHPWDLVRFFIHIKAKKSY